MRNCGKKITTLIVAAAFPLISFAENGSQAEPANPQNAASAGIASDVKPPVPNAAAPAAEPGSVQAATGSAPNVMPNVTPNAGANPAPIDANAPIAVTGTIKVADRPFYYGSGLFALGGAIGGLVAAHAWKDEPERIAAYVSQEKIDIAGIVKTEFEKQINAKPEFAETFKAKAPAKFDMSILYGITSVPFKQYRPYLAVHVTLVDEAGNVKWKNRDYVGGHGDAPSIPYEDFYKSADVFQSEFNVAAHEVVGLLLKDFHL